MRSVRREIALLVLVNAFVGGMVGLERTLLPLLAEAEFGIASAAAAASFVVTFGLSKALVNLFAGRLADRYGRKRILVAGWLFAIPLPLILAFATDWSQVVAANALLGVNQGLAWSMSVNMKLDRVGPERRGLVVGLNEAAGYTGLAVVAFLTGLLATSYGLRPIPFLLGAGIALAGLALSLGTRDVPRDPAPSGSLRRALRDARLAPISFAGLATNLKDGALWILLPTYLASRGVALTTIALVVAAYPLAWGIAQLATGPLSDRVGRRALAVGGLATQAAGVGLLLISPSVFAAVVVGLGTALAYPTLLALVADVAAPAVRATSLGVYRFWRDAGYAVGALAAGALADAAGFGAAFLAVAGVVGASGAVLLVRR